MSIPSIQGTLSAGPYDDRGTLSAPPVSRGGTISAPASVEPEDSTIADLGGLISQLGSLSAQAQSLPLELSAPTLPGLPQQNYQSQPTDYMQLTGDANS